MPQLSPGHRRSYIFQMAGWQHSRSTPVSHMREAEKIQLHPAPTPITRIYKGAQIMQMSLIQVLASHQDNHPASLPWDLHYHINHRKFQSRVVQDRQQNPSKWLLYLMAA